jgi:hypothetical protein
LKKCADRTAGDVPRVLDSLSRGEQKATAELLPIIYDELDRLARATARS